MTSVATPDFFNLVITCIMKMGIIDHISTTISIHFSNVLPICIIWHVCIDAVTFMYILLQLCQWMLLFVIQQPAFSSITWHIAN